MPIIAFRENGKSYFLAPTVMPENIRSRVVGASLYETCPFRDVGPFILGFAGGTFERMHLLDACPWDKIFDDGPIGLVDVLGGVYLPEKEAITRGPKAFNRGIDFVVTNGEDTYVNYDPRVIRYNGETIVLGPYRTCQPVKNILDAQNITSDQMTLDIALSLLKPLSRYLNNNIIGYPMYLLEAETKTLTVLEEDGSRHVEKIPTKEDYYAD